MRTARARRAGHRRGTGGGPVAGVVIGAVLLAVAGCGSGSVSGGSASGSGGSASGGSAEGTSAAGTTTAPAPPPSCAARTLGRLGLEEQVGQLLMVGVPATDPVGGFAALSDVPVGGLFLHGRNSAGVASVAAALAQLQARSALPLQIAADQEGGLVQTLKGPGFDRLPSALAQAAHGPEALRAAVRGWAAQLRSAGITLDLAPVADTVPVGTEADNPPIGAFDRQYGSDPAEVADAVTAAVGGLQDAGVAATVKHFPGLGRVQVNTDLDAGGSDPETNAADPYLAPFAAAVTAGVGAVMVGSASYPQLDPDHLAVFSPAVLALLRDQLGFAGVVVTDDLGQAVALAGVPVGQRAVDAVAAGVDVVLTVVTADARPMAKALTARATADPVFATRVRESTGRVLALKERFGLLTC